MVDFLNSTPTLLTSILGFIITISFLVTIHEYGHFWVARKFGVKIEKFSIGFGKPIFKWYGKKDNIEYSISWIPLGGYVKMYGESAKELKAKEQEYNNIRNDITNTCNIHQGSFSSLHPFKRFLIAFAGPAVNLIFAILALWFLFIMGIPAIKPYIGNVGKDSIFAKANIQSGSKIISINDNKIQTLTESIIYLVDSIGNPKTKIITDKDNIKSTYFIDLSHLSKGSELEIEKTLGFNWEIADAANNIEAKINIVSHNSPADKAGIKKGDIIIKANNNNIKTWQQFVKKIQSHPQKQIDIIVSRNGINKSLILIPKKNPQNPKIGYAGVSPYFNTDYYNKYKYVKKFGILESLPMAVKENYLLAKITLKTLGKIIIGDASIKNVGGPITIADYSGKTIRMGYVEYLNFLAAISLTLAIMNLLPIPVLDGGHMLIYAAEMIRKKPLSESTASILLRVGLAIIITFMIMVITVDLWKYITG